MPMKETGLAELLATFCDRLLVKSSAYKEEEELLVLLKQVIVLFNYLKDKDVFKEIY